MCWEAHGLHYLLNISVESSHKASDAVGAEAIEWRQLSLFNSWGSLDSPTDA